VKRKIIIVTLFITVKLKILDYDVSLFNTGVSYTVYNIYNIIYIYIYEPRQLFPYVDRKLLTMLGTIRGRGERNEMEEGENLFSLEWAARFVFACHHIATVEHNKLQHHTKQRNNKMIISKVVVKLTI
jgi:hypothetical protein